LLGATGRRGQPISTVNSLKTARNQKIRVGVFTFLVFGASANSEDELERRMDLHVPSFLKPAEGFGPQGGSLASGASGFQRCFNHRKIIGSSGL
jgi:hypothetical protein